jgi:hypothetical protein
MVRHRLSLAGNRKLNNALYMVAICQARSDAQGGTYYRKKKKKKKMAEGKNPARRRCGASRGASPTPSTRALLQTCRHLHAAQLDKEEPRKAKRRSSLQNGGSVSS